MNHQTLPLITLTFLQTQTDSLLMPFNSCLSDASRGQTEIMQLQSKDIIKVVWVNSTFLEILTWGHLTKMLVFFLL